MAYHYSPYLIILLCVLTLHNACFGQASNNVQLSGPEDWVTHIDANMEAQPEDGEKEGIYYLLINKQINIAKAERYFSSAYRIMTTDGLQQNADLTIDFDPTYQQLVFHEATIIRNGERLNQLHPISIKVVQREQQMDRYLYDGELTAIVHLSDLRIGDIVEYSYTKKGFNPVYDGHYSEELYFEYSVPYERGFFQIIAPNNKEIRLIYRNGEDQSSTSTIDKDVIHTWDFSKMEAVNYENNTPGWYSYSFKVMITDFKSWNDLMPWATKYYQLDVQQVEKLKSEIGDYFLGENSQATALNVIRFVQDEVRYLGFEDGIHSHQPHIPYKVFQQRFGDCKDKSMLLCAMLASYDIEAYPVIVNSRLRKNLEDHMPAISSFDHVVTQIIADGDTIYVDPTISNQGGTFNNIYFPNYGKGFIVHPTNGGIADISSEGTAKISELNDYTLDKVGGGSGLIIHTTYYGAEADHIRSQLASSSLDQIQQSYLNYYANRYSDIEAEYPIKVEDNRSENILETTEYYRIPTFWNNDNDELTTYFYAGSLDPFVDVGKSQSRRMTPYQLNFPTTYSHKMKIWLAEPWNIEEGEMFISQPEYSYFHRASYSGQELLLEHEYNTLQSYVPVEKIERFISDHTRIRNNLTFQLNYNKTVFTKGGGVATPALVLTILTLLIGLWLMLKMYRYDMAPENEKLSATAARPIGGWLILFTIGVVISPIVFLYQIFIDDFFFNPGNWFGYMQAGHIANSLFMSIQLIYQLLLFLFSIVFAVLFFQRRSNVPRLVLIRFLGNLFIAMVIMAFGSAVVEGVEYGQEDLFELFTTFVSAAIWVPYFMTSKRVKDTFLTRLYQPHQDELVPTTDLVAEGQEE